MKKHQIYALILLLLCIGLGIGLGFSLVSCSGSPGGPSPSPSGASGLGNTNGTVGAGVSGADGAEGSDGIGGAISSDNGILPGAANHSQKVDIDLSPLSSTLVFAEVNNIMQDPDGYLGKVIKIRGPYAVNYFEETDCFYHFVLVNDDAACCSAGLEFTWNGEHTYPDDYPEQDSMIELVGKFQEYEELGRKYYHLEVDELVVL